MRKTPIILLLLVVFAFGFIRMSVGAQESPSTIYIPLIGITSVPEPLALPRGEGNVTYKYAVKTFLPEVPLSNIQVVDNNCDPIKFEEGDDNGNSRLDYDETWRYSCKTKLTETTQSTATATGETNNTTATHKAYATVVVGSSDPPPLVSIVNITKVASPLSLPEQGGEITFTYKVNNPGVAPLSNVTVTDDKCDVLAGKLGDTNGNNLLDIHEVWIYTCTTTLTQTTTNTVEVEAFANGLKAVDDTSITVKVEGSTELAQSIPGLPNAGGSPGIKIIAWMTLAGILLLLIMLFILKRKMELNKIQKKFRNFRK